MEKILNYWGWGIGYGGLGMGDWAQSPIPNPQSPIPNPQSPIPKNLNLIVINFLPIINYLKFKKLKLIILLMLFIKVLQQDKLPHINLLILKNKLSMIINI